MKRLRLIGAGGILGIAGLMALPVSTAHAASAITATATADSSAMTVSLNPEAVFNMNPAVAQLYQTLKPLTDALSNGKGLGSLSVSLDRSRALGSLTGDLNDLLKGHSDSAALAIDFHALDGVLALLDTVLKSLTSVTGPLASVLQGVPTIGAQLTTLAGALNSNNPLTDLLNNLGAQVNASTSADYNNPPAANLAHSSVGLVDLTRIQALPHALQLQLAPFVANAVPAALAPSLNLAGPVVEAHNTTTSLALVPKLGALGGLDVSSLLSSLLSLDLGTTITTALNLANQGTTAVQGVLAGTPLASVGATLGTVTQTVNGAATQVVNTAPLAALQAQLTSLTSNLTLLQSLAGALPSLNNIIKTDGVTSTASLLPLSGNTVQAIASTKLVALHVLPLDNLPVLGNVSLLDVLGVSSSADTSLTSLANQPAWKDATSSLSQINVLGKEIVGPNGMVTVDQLLQGLQRPLDITIPGVGGFEIVVTRGAPTRVDTPTERKATISALSIRISTISGPNLLLPLTSGFGANAVSAGSASQNGLIADVQLGTVSTDVQLNAPAAETPSTPTAAAPQNPTTGMFGPMAAVGGAGIAAVAILMQLIPRIAARRRRVG